MKQLWKCKKCSKFMEEEFLLENPVTGELCCGDVMCGGPVERIRPDNYKKDRMAKEAEREPYD